MVFLDFEIFVQTLLIGNTISKSKLEMYTKMKIFLSVILMLKKFSKAFQNSDFQIKDVQPTCIMYLCVYYVLVSIRN